jgi:hypothetical protein
MRYLLNLPLLIAMLCLFMVFDTAVLSRTSGGPDAALGAAYAILFGTFMTWLMLGAVLIGCGALGALRWPGVRGAGGAAVALLAFGLIVAIATLPVSIAMESHAAARFGPGQTTLARLVAFGLPLVLLLYAGWMINAPHATRTTAAPHVAALGLTGLLCVVALAVSVRELGRQAQVAQADAAAAARQVDEQNDEVRRRFAALTDSDTLLAWYAYTTYAVPDDVRLEALRRIAARPQLEAELATALASDNAAWSEAVLALIISLPFTPSATLVRPVTDAITAYADRLQEGATMSTATDDRLDRYEGYELDTVLKLSVRMAESNGADLRDAIDAVARAVALYPKSATAQSFLRRAAETRAQISQAVAARHR